MLVNLAEDCQETDCAKRLGKDSRKGRIEEEQRKRGDFEERPRFKEM